MSVAARAVRLSEGRLRTIERVFLLLVLFAICLVPSRLSWLISDLRISPARLLLLISIIPLGLTFLDSLARGETKLSVTDWAIAFFSAWFFVGVSVVNGLDVAIASSAIVIVELVGTYLIGRVLGGTADGIRILLAGFAWCVVICVSVGLVDTVAGQHVVNNFAADATNNDHTFLQYRGGVLRATSTFDHPILFGTFCVFAFVLLWNSGGNLLRRLLLCSLSVIGVLIAISSGPILGLAVALVAIVYGAIFQSVEYRWRAAFLFGGAVMVLVVVSLEVWLPAAIDNFTLDPETGRFRLLIWHYAGREVWQSPLWGIGFNDWIRPQTIGGAEFGESVDSFWLYWSLRAGIPGALALGIAIVSAAMESRSQVAMDGFEKVRDALTICLVVVVLVGFTVHFYQNIWLLIGLLLGTRVSLGRRNYALAGQR